MSRPARIPNPTRALAPLFGAVVRPLQRFFELEAASGILLLACAIASLAWANASADTYQRVFGTRFVVGAGARVLSFTLRQAVNEALMTVFFFVVGMEIKRELIFGELRTLGRAALPAVAAVGGMAVPALIYVAVAGQGPALAGWGIPMATDIAFCIGVLTLLRSRVPQGLVVFLTALAIFDDIGGIVVIALFYGHGIDATWLLASAVVAGLLVAAGRMNATRGMLWLAGGILLWYAVHHSGIHATISGVALGLAVPGRLRHSPREVLRELTVHTASLMERSEDDEVDGEGVATIEHRLEQLASPLTRFVRRLHPLVAFGIMPAFALANSGIPLRDVGRSDLVAGATLGTALGLLAGKPLGICAFTLVAVRLRLAPMPGSASFAKLLGTSVVGGIGFTVAIFIATLAFPGEPRLLLESKLGILAASMAAGVIGAGILALTARLGGEGVDARR